MQTTKRAKRCVFVLFIIGRKHKKALLYIKSKTGKYACKGDIERWMGCDRSLVNNKCQVGFNRVRPYPRFEAIIVLFN